LALAGSTLYGTTPSGGRAGEGTVFAVNPSTGGEKVLHSFGPLGGTVPRAGLIFEGSSLYGVTFYGGKCSTGGCGTVFSMNPANGRATTLYSLTGGAGGLNPNAPLVYQAGLLYGTTVNGGGSTACANGCGTIFSVDLAAKRLSKVIYAFTGASDGASPSNGPLAYQNGVFYGATLSGGANGNGVVFMLTP
jgi:uncharacterized repeat protein (TIGR03803 family)